MAHADTNFLKEMPTTAVSRDEVELLYLQTTLERISNDIENPRNWNDAVIGIQEIK